MFDFDREIIKKKGKAEERYSNCVFTFDVETTSVFLNNGVPEQFSHEHDENYYKDMEKIGFVYLWQFGINDDVYYGRTLEEFKFFIDKLIEYCECKIIIYIHNAQFEFAFLRNVFCFNNVFARKKRRPIYFTYNNAEFRCSYMLTRLSLDNWAKEKKLPVKKLTGTIDYTVIRTPFTTLEEELIKYGENDILVMYYGLLEYKKRYLYMYEIPLTQTGIVRREYNELMAGEKEYHKKMIKLLPQTLSEYSEMIDDFWGGVTHASRLYSNVKLHNVLSRDIASSYPWVMISEKFPMTPFIDMEYDEMYETKEYSYLIRVELLGVKCKGWNTYISLSKCIDYKNAIVDNGRIIDADYLLIGCTNVDFNIIKKTYKIKSINILSFKLSINGHLSPVLGRYIIDLYNNKTSLGGDIATENLYKKSKEKINALYGMMVTRLITDDVVWKNNEWGSLKLDVDRFRSKIAKQRNNFKKMNSAFQHGIFIPAYARRNLWDAVLALDDYTVYVDTDSVKYIECDDSFFEKYNAKVIARYADISNRLGVNADKLHPYSPKKNRDCPIGIFECEGQYKQFKTLGAKKYAFIKKDEIEITVSGVRKEAASALGTLDDFKIGFVFDIEHAKKLLLHYNDNQTPIIINKGNYDEYECNYRYGVCAHPTTYTLGWSDDYYGVLEDIIAERSEILKKEGDLL